MNSLKKITIVGCGLLGGSFALATRRAGFKGRISGFGGSKSVDVALERGIIDEREAGFDAAAGCDADLVFLAAPIGGIIDFLKTRSHFLTNNPILTDAGSTKAEICAVAREFALGNVRFVGGHPMAGSQQGGVVYARADLFEGATWALIDDGSIEALDRMTGIVEQMGAKPLRMPADVHDAAVATISHLPQLVATALAEILNSCEGDEVRLLAATGWRDMTRLAGSSWPVWRDIFLTNQPNISHSLEALISRLSVIREALDARDFGVIRELFLSANLSVEKQRQVHLRSFSKE